MKRVSKHEAFNFLRHLIALDAQSCQLLRKTRQDDAGGLGARDHDGLLGESLEDVGSPGFPHARSGLTSRFVNCFWVSAASCAGAG